MTDDHTQNPAISTALPDRRPDGKFVKGGPGRVRGTKNKVSRETLIAIQQMGPDALAGLLDNVGKGDQRAIEFVLERIVGNQRLVELDAATPDAIAQAIIDGDLNSSEAKAVTASLTSLKMLQDMGTINERMEQLEVLLKGES